MTRLNYFRPYASKGAWHEDQLTRAYLSTLRLVPMALASFLERVRETQRENGAALLIPPPLEAVPRVSRIQTQVESLADREGLGLSVLVSNDRFTLTKDVAAVKRGARYDGVLEIAGDGVPSWTLVIENKPWRHAAYRSQLDLDAPAGLDVQPVLADLDWKDLVGTLRLIRERDLVAGAEALLVDDFLELIDSDFDYLNPYATFAICRNSKHALRRRCSRLAEELAPGRVQYHVGGGDTIRLGPGAVGEVWLDTWFDERHEGHLDLCLYAADTFAQAHDFYAGLDVTSFLALADAGWDMYPVLKFSRIQQVLTRVERSPGGLEAYLRSWKDRLARERLRELDASTGDAASFLKALTDEGVLTGEDAEGVLQKAEGASRLRVCPAVGMELLLPLTSASDLERRGLLVSHLAERLDEAMRTWGGRWQAG